jgi:hypothetical protein
MSFLFCLCLSPNIFLSILRRARLYFKISDFFSIDSLFKSYSILQVFVLVLLVLLFNLFYCISSILLSSLAITPADTSTFIAS